MYSPDASPYAVTTATNLPIYDEAYACLRAEYMAVSMGFPVDELD